MRMVGKSRKQAADMLCRLLSFQNEMMLLPRRSRMGVRRYIEKHRKRLGLKPLTYKEVVRLKGRRVKVITIKGSEYR